MEKFSTIDEVLEFAINEEEKAVDFYNELASKANNAEMKTIFFDFAKEEMAHKARLLKVKAEKQYTLQTGQVTDLRISDYVVNVKVSENMTYPEALVLAMQKEKAAFKLYMALSEKATSTDMKAVFLNLAQEESKHKLRFEIEYDENVLREN